MKRLFGQGKILKEEIKRKGFRLNFVAEKADIPYGTFDSYVNDRYGIPVVLLKEILRLFPEFDRKLFNLDASAQQQRLPLSENKREAASA